MRRECCACARKAGVAAGDAAGGAAGGAGAGFPRGDSIERSFVTPLEPSSETLLGNNDCSNGDNLFACLF